MSERDILEAEARILLETYLGKEPHMADVSMVAYLLEPTEQRADRAGYERGLREAEDWLRGYAGGSEDERALVAYCADAIAALRDRSRRG